MSDYSSRLHSKLMEETGTGWKAKMPNNTQTFCKNGKIKIYAQYSTYNTRY